MKLTETQKRQIKYFIQESAMQGTNLHYKLMNDPHKETFKTKTFTGDLIEICETLTEELINELTKGE